MADIIASRLDKIDVLSAGGHKPYPYAFQRTYTITGLQFDLDCLLEQETSIAIAGRLVAKRVMDKVCFAHVHDDNGRLRIYLQRNAVEDRQAEAYVMFRKSVDLGDWIGLQGTLMLTQTGERMGLRSALLSSASRKISGSKMRITYRNRTKLH